ncbi:phytoene desaturase family protein [Alkalispirochaeta alkalica]|uniref:phytoene desaturase family protein n=1 Tax=Alkalispirochaeta alkalica TaxID=46356 RepID=UPI0003690F47|nr:phytoene desaturase family protein [Alkalispirochaeta alkalica]
MAAVKKAGNALIIGAGLGGLAAALELASRGWRVQVLDQRSGPGGKAFTEHLGPYRFDTGPSLLTLLPVFDELFALTGVDREAYFGARPLEEIARYFWPDGTALRSFSSPRTLADSFSRAGIARTREVLAYLEHSRKLYERSTPLFLYDTIDPRSLWRRPALWPRLLGILGLDTGRTLHEVHRSFFRDSRARQFFDRYATYNGSNPYEAPGTLALIPHVEYGLGAWAPEGGIYTIPLAMERRAREMGVEFCYACTVEGLAPPAGEGGGWIAETSRGSFEADVLFSNIDPRGFYGLLGDPPRTRRYQVEDSRLSSSALVFYWGLGNTYPQTGLHNIFFGSDYPGEFRSIFQDRQVPEDPTIYVNITAKYVPGDAPEGSENWFVLVNAPPRGEQNWDEVVPAVRERVIASLEKRLDRDIGRYIQEESWLAPPGIEELTGSCRGSLYGPSSNHWKSAFLRHPNKSSLYRHLYFCGGSAHPGGGMPLVVLSGRLAVRELLRSW